MTKEKEIRKKWIDRAVTISYAAIVIAALVFIILIRWGNYSERTRTVLSIVARLTLKLVFLLGFVQVLRDTKKTRVIVSGAIFFIGNLLIEGLLYVFGYNVYYVTVWVYNFLRLSIS